jgi:hypothetical protein
VSLYLHSHEGAAEIHRTEDRETTLCIGWDPTDIYIVCIYMMVDGMQVQQVTGAGQSKPNIVWL